jgi:hypothetical protein
MVLLFTIFLLLSWLREALKEEHRGLVMGTFALAALVLYTPPTLAAIAIQVARAQSIPNTPELGATPKAMIEWLRENTTPDAVVVVQPTEVTNWETAWIAFERRTDRSTLVSSKFVPTLPQDLARWYQLIRWREAVFAGACGRLKEQPVDYLVVVQSSTLEKVAGCGNLVWHRDGYAIVAVGERLTARPPPASVAVD